MIMLLPVICPAQQLTVSESASDQPLAFALVYSPKNKLLLTTNVSGQVDISSLTGLEKIQISAFGFRSISVSFQDLELIDFRVKLSPSIIALQQVLVTATKWEQARAEIPAHLVSIDRETVRLLGPQTAADMLGTSGEVFIQKSQQGGGSPMIRGFSANRLLYTVDGVRMNTAIFRSGNLHNVISLDPFAIANTEVFFGPGAILYGSDAIGAVMNFQTLQPEFSDSSGWKIKGTAVLRSATANKENTGHISLIYGNNRWAGVSSFSTYDFGDLKMGTRGPEEYLKKTIVTTLNGQDLLIHNQDPEIQIPTAYEQLNLMQKIRFKASDQLILDYAFHMSLIGGYDRFDRLIRFRPNGLPGSAEWKYGPQKWKMHQFKLHHTLKNRFYDEFMLNLAFQEFEESRIDRNFNNPVRRTRTENVDALSINLDFQKSWGIPHKIFYGLEGIHNDVKSSGVDKNIVTTISSKGATRYPQANWNSAAAYLTYQYKIAPYSLIQSGVRYNSFGLKADFTQNLAFFPLPFTQVNSRKGALTGSLGWLYSPATSWTLHLNASTGFRAPNVDDIGKFFDSEPGTVMVPNPDLREEYAYNVEMNIGKVLAEKIALEFTGYYTFLDQALVRRDFSLAGRDSILYDGSLSKVFALQNSAWVTVRGLQAAVEVQFNSSLSFSSKINIQKGTEVMEDGQRSPSRHAPPTFGISRLNYRKGLLQFQVFAEYAGSFAYYMLPLEERGKPELYARDSNGLPYSPSWMTLNFKSIIELGERLKVSAGVENILDQRFRAYSSGIAAPGRNFTFAVFGDF
jgi:hemoglobin/transferrin/lactoferrin receptor protein